jgi:hypothetical protein
MRNTTSLESLPTTTRFLELDRYSTLTLKVFSAAFGTARQSKIQHPEI